MTVVALLTGAISGRRSGVPRGPGSAADLVLRPLSVYVGYIALWEALDGPQAPPISPRPLPRRLGLRAALALRRLLLEPGPHQGPSLSLDRAGERGTTPSTGRSSSPSPGFVLLFVSLVLLRTRAEIPRPAAPGAARESRRGHDPRTWAGAAAGARRLRGDAGAARAGLVGLSWLRGRADCARARGGRKRACGRGAMAGIRRNLLLARAAARLRGVRGGRLCRAPARGRRRAAERLRRPPRPRAGSAGGAARRPAPDRRRSAGARREARQLLGQLVRPLPRRAPAPERARRRGRPGARHQLQGRARQGARLPRRARRPLRPASAPTPAAAPGSTGASMACPRPSWSTRSRHHPPAPTPARSPPTWSRTASAPCSDPPGDPARGQPAFRPRGARRPPGRGASPRWRPMASTPSSSSARRACTG